MQALRAHVLPVRLTGTRLLSYSPHACMCAHTCKQPSSQGPHIANCELRPLGYMEALPQLLRLPIHLHRERCSCHGHRGWRMEPELRPCVHVSHEVIMMITTAGGACHKIVRTLSQFSGRGQASIESGCGVEQHAQVTPHLPFPWIGVAAGSSAQMRACHCHCLSHMPPHAYACISKRTTTKNPIWPSSATHCLPPNTLTLSS